MHKHLTILQYDFLAIIRNFVANYLQTLIITPMKRLHIIYILMYALTFILPLNAQKAGDVISVKGSEVARYFQSSPIPDEVFRRMQGKSFPKHCTVKRSELRYLRVLHRNKDGMTQVGEMICNHAIAADLLDIFRQLYDAGYPIERMVLIDEYDASDDRSMAANNTSCFNFRLMTGSTTRISLHGRGMAIDINPLYNPYVAKGMVSPSNGKPYAYNRESLARSASPVSTQPNAPGEWWRSTIITVSSLPYRLFTQHGFRWGGNFKRNKDYQHFEK